MLKRINDAYQSGKYHFQYVYKTAIPASGTAGFFVDVNQSSGIPVYNAFAGSALAFTPLSGQKNQGIYLGPRPALNESKYLHRLQAVSTTASNPSLFYVCDYLGFYSLVDSDSTDLQEMDNNQSLTRFSDGAGVRIALIATAPMSATASCTLVYTNQDGVTGRSVTFNVIPAASIGVCATASGTAGTSSCASPFVGLVSGDTGVRAIESITFTSGAGGFLCACLVNPIALIQSFEASVATEKTFGLDSSSLPQVHSDAYLNFLVQRGSTASINLQAELIFLNI